jgi:hypothetical protein
MPETLATPRVTTHRDVMTIIVIPWLVNVTTGGAKEQIRLQRQFRIDRITASLGIAASAGTTTVDINVNGATILSTKLTIDAGEKTSRTAAIPLVLTRTDFEVDDEFVFDVDATGTGAAGLKVYIIGWQLGGQT